MKVVRGLFLAVFLSSLSSCALESGDAGLYIFSFEYDFSESTHDWVTGFSDYPAGPDDSAFFELKHAHTGCPTGGGKAIMISGNNHNDDLFMFIKKKISGLKPNSDYTLTFDVELASNAPHGVSGSNGAPGENVFLKVGASGMEPKSVIEENKFAMNIDKGNQGEGGEDMIPIGDIATLDTSGNYTIISRSNLASSNTQPLTGRTNSRGELWFIVGTDSGFEGVTTLYYTAINVVLSSPN